MAIPKFINFGEVFPLCWRNNMTKSRNDIDFSQVESDTKIKGCLLKHLGENTAALALITSYIPAKISPTKVARAQIGLIEELGMEDAIAEIKENDIDRLYLLINTFGGGVSSSFKIARALRENFSDITVFIPHIAASGGTLIALTGNKIVMGDMSSISPIDVQIQRSGNTFSVNAMMRSFHTLNEMFKDVSENDAPYPWKAMADKLDPVEFQEWVDTSRLMERHAAEILQHPKSSLKSKTKTIVGALSRNYPTHQYTITYEEAKPILGDDVCFKNSCKEYGEIWKTMKLWLRQYIMQESGTHIIRYLTPEKLIQDENTNIKGDSEDV
jgi:hypothetical protein